MSATIVVGILCFQKGLGMNTFQFDSKIVANKAAITKYQIEIRELEEKVNNLHKYIDKLAHDSEHINRFAGKSSRLIQSLSDHHGSRASANQSFFSDLFEVTTGSGFSKAKRSMNASKAKAEKKNIEMKRRIEELKQRIQTCNNNIESLKSQRSAYIAKERKKEAARK